MKIAVTGGIGAGKSTVLTALRQYLPEYQFFSIDDEVSKLYHHSNVTEFLRVMGIKDKSEMSTIAFENPFIKKKLEEIINPMIHRSLERWLKRQYVIVEFPLLFQYQLQHLFDLTVSISAREDVRCKRVMLRNPEFTRDKVLSIIHQQVDQSTINGSADIVFMNDISSDDFNGTSDPYHSSSWHLKVKELANTIKQHDKPKSSVLKKQTSNEILRKVSLRKSSKIGAVSSSFDPITKGHLYVIDKALSLVDVVYIMIAKNDKKQSYLTDSEKLTTVKESIIEELGTDAMVRCRVEILPEESLLISHAKDRNVKFIFRGIRNGTDFDYENSINLAQHLIDDTIETIYILPPRKITEVSSSLVKTLFKFPAAQVAVEEYVTKSVLNTLKNKSKL